MKQPVIQRMRVTLDNGAVLRLCCGPAVASYGERVVAYEPVGKPARGVCCHPADRGPARIWLLGEHQMRAVRDWLARRAGAVWG